MNEPKTRWLFCKDTGESGKVEKLEHCTLCDELTDRFEGDADSLFDSNGHGPYCDNCFDDLEDKDDEERCVLCDELTDRVEGDEHSLYTYKGSGPYCANCYDDLKDKDENHD